MPRAGSGPEVRSAGVRALGVGSGRECPACGKPISGRQRACSAKCRAALSRQRRADRLKARDREIRGLLEVALKRLEDR
jgi:predicted nucleic acid-binding Zn ribbon protein